ncbi:GNAT family N-acetyltransferase [Marinobacter sp. SBS5]|uniref:GNAT family N-acetyltransferase n=1 Tax=Marinobacter sp. SBS5 TaxID=3401754 RepID=UPI003AADD321
MLIAESLELKLLSLDHKDELFPLVDSNREHLREWLPWVDATQSPVDSESFLESAINQFQSGQGPQYAIFSGSILCGVCGFHPFDLANRTGSLGYWLSQSYSGKGIMALAVKALVEQGFREREYLYGRYVDQAMYSMLASEFSG